MGRYFALIFLVACGACAPKAKPAVAPPAATTSAAAKSAPAPVAPAVAPAPVATPGPAPSAAPKPAPGPPPLTGVVTRDAIESFNDVWKGLRAQDYEPDAAAVSAIASRVGDLDVFAVVATWCPDSRRDLPRFFKIADKAGLPMSRVKLLAVDRTKKDAEGQTEKWNVTRVPTFIFLRAGKEIGRVVERPTTTLEQDIAAIVK
jgi:thiol-disulfide isomerase/thioredoxin